MSDLPCNLNLFLQASFGQEEVQFRTDVLLPQPILLAPIDNAHICLTANRNSTSHIALAWTAVTGATNYVLQWGDSEDMSSPSLRQEILSTTAFTLFRNRDIRLGQTIYWRVFAINLSGGVSLPSATRQLTYTCPEGKEANKESTFNVEAELLGPDTIRSCEDTSYYVKISFTSRDANFREICQYTSTTWSAEYIGSAAGTTEIRSPADNDLKAEINTRINGTTSGNLKITAEVTFLDVLKNEPFTKQLTKEVISEPFGFGCGLVCNEVCVDDDPTKTTRKVEIDFIAIAGDGLAVKDPNDLPVDDPEYDACGCPKLELDPNTGCGISFDLISPEDPTLGKELSVNLSDLFPAAGYEWLDQDCNNSTFQTNCGMTTTSVAIVQGRVWYDPEMPTSPYSPYGGDCPKQIFAEVNIPLECSLKNGTGGLAVDLEAIAGPGLTITDDDCPKLSVTGVEPIEYSAGCGISISMDVIGLDLAGFLESAGYEWTGNNCENLVFQTNCGESTDAVAIVQGRVYYDPTITASPYEDCAKQVFAEVNIPLECPLKNGTGGITVDVPSGSIPAPLTVAGITGNNLVEESDVEKAVAWGTVTYNKETDSGCGEWVTKTYLPFDCHFDTTGGKIKLDLTRLAGDGLSVQSGECPKLKSDAPTYTAGCGINISVGNAISIDLSDIASSAAYTWDDTYCSGVLADGCSTGSGLAGTQGVFQLPGLVLYDTTGTCPTLHSRVNLPYNCSLEIDNGNLGLNYDIVGKGLTTSSDDCPKIELCVEDGTSPIAEIAGTDLDASGSAAVVYGEVNHQAPSPYEAGCGKLITKSVLPVGCHFDLTNGKLELDLSALAGAGLSLTDDECPKLKVDFSETSCDIASLLGLCAAPAVTPTTNDFVLGLRPGEDGTCCIVKFVITACPTDEPPVDPGEGPSPP